jgi:hypothetical protein
VPEASLAIEIALLFIRRKSRLVGVFEVDFAYLAGRGGPKAQDGQILAVRAVIAAIAHVVIAARVAAQAFPVVVGRAQRKLVHLLAGAIYAPHGGLLAIVTEGKVRARFGRGA